MAPKPRKKDKHLPQRVYHKHNAYYYQHKGGKWQRLGKTLTEAMNEWSKIVNLVHRIHTMNQLFDRYMMEIAPTKALATFKQNQFQMQQLRLFFGDMAPEEVTAPDIYRYLDLRARKSKVAPNREKALLSHCFSMAIRWGLVTDNPCRNVKRLTERPRKRYVNDQEYIAVKCIASPLLQCLMDFALLSGQRIGDILKIKLSDLSDEGIYIQQSKTGTKLIIEWSEHLIEVVNRIKSLRNKCIVSLYLFNNKKGHPMTYDSFKSIWQPTIKKALEQKLIDEPFNFHDLRSKTASDSKDKQNVSALLGHADIKLTKKIYIRTAEKVRPFK